MVKYITEEEVLKKRGYDPKRFRIINTSFPLLKHIIVKKGFDRSIKVNLEIIKIDGSFDIDLMLNHKVENSVTISPTTNDFPADEILFQISRMILQAFAEETRKETK
jgi:hypothetical protein